MAQITARRFGLVEQPVGRWIAMIEERLAADERVETLGPGTEPDQ
jgi:hypothetical protein